MQKELSRILSQLKFVQNGPAWHGKSLSEALDSLEYQQAAAQVYPDSKSIWELVLHMIAWRTFTVEKVRKNEAFQIEIGSEVDWPEIEEVSEKAWGNCLAELDHISEKLQIELKSKLDTLLAETVPGKAYTFYILLHGIVQHDAYHCGQVVLTRKMLDQMKA